MIPEHLRYTSEHEWLTLPDEEAVCRIGVTDFAQQALGDVVFVQLPDLGEVVVAGEPLGELESTKSVSEVYSPISGTISAVNTALADNPDLVNSDPYGTGWLVEVQVSGGEEPVGLLDAAGYEALTREV